jgi:hypothetical protein
MKAIERLKGMVNKAFLYNNEEVVILNFYDGSGDDGNDVEIYLNNGKTLIFNRSELIFKLERFRPITQMVVVLSDQRLAAVSTINPTIIKDIRDIVLEQIKNVKDDPETIGQAKQVFQGVNTLINLAKAEIEYKKYLDKYDGNRQPL